ncbi:MAG: transglutaminase-like domain-containing protein, partial [Gemmatimonadota bacterium]
DVDGHTLLFVGMARASGIPARTVSGLLLSGDRYYFHSWAEVYLGRWVAVDPTYDEVPADAGRIRLAIGALSRPMELLPLVAGMDAQLLTLDHRP